MISYDPFYEDLPTYIARDCGSEILSQQLKRPYAWVQLIVPTLSKTEKFDNGNDEGKTIDEGATYNGGRKIVPLPREDDSKNRGDVSYIVHDCYAYEPGVKELNEYSKRCLVEENAGGQSCVSEAHSIAHLMREMLATTCILEQEVKYFPKYKMIDYIIGVPSGTHYGEITRIGVSVTRALCEPQRQYTREDGIRLLKKKLYGLCVSRNTVCAEHCFYQSILHVFVPSKDIACMLIDIIVKGEVDLNELEILGTLDIVITESRYIPIFTNTI